MVTLIDAAAYADIVKLMPWLSERQETLKLRSTWTLTVLDLLVMDMAIAPAAAWAIDEELVGMTEKLAQLQDCLRQVLNAQGLFYPRR